MTRADTAVDDEARLRAALSDRGVDPSVPSIARMYDYFLGGKDNFATDRKAAERVIAVYPNSRAVCRENRAFLGRVVRYLAEECGIRQFLDIGSGLPTAKNVHEIAQAVDPAPGWSTSTTTRWSSCTLRHCLPGAPEAA